MANKTNYPVLAVVFDEEGKILMAQRNEARSNFHRLWQFPGGGIEFGEDPKDAVVREVREETGLNVKLLSQHPFAFNYSDPLTNSHIIVLGFVAKYVSGQIDTSKDRNTGDAQWFTYDEIDFAHCVPLTKELVDSAVAYLDKEQEKQD